MIASSSIKADDRYFIYYIKYLEYFFKKVVNFPILLRLHDINRAVSVSLLKSVLNSINIRQLHTLGFIYTTEIIEMFLVAFKTKNITMIAT